MSDQNKNSPVVGAGKNERDNNSQDNTGWNQGNRSNLNGKHNNNGWKYRRNKNDISLNFHFEGAKPEIGGALTLCTEKVKKKLPCQVFKEKLTNYVMTKLDGGKDLHIAILHLKDPFEKVEKEKQ